MKEQTTIRLPAKLKKQLRQKADELGMPMKDLVIFIFHLHFYGAILPR